MATVVLGDEFDQDLIRRVQAKLKAIGARKQHSAWALGGSQEVRRQEWRTADAKLLLEAETYLGLSLTGPDDLVASIATELRG